MKKQDEYIVKEVFTFPLICLVCVASFFYWGCADGWPVGAIIGTSFFGIITMCYVGKYILFGRNYMKIDADGIEIKDRRKITVLKWSDIKKCEVYYRSSYGSAVLFVRDLFRGCLIISVKSQVKKSEMDLYLRRRSIAVAM